jgi:hypothetical protein
MHRVLLMPAHTTSLFAHLFCYERINAFDEREDAAKHSPAGVIRGKEWFWLKLLPSARLVAGGRIVLGWPWVAEPCWVQS